MFCGKAKEKERRASTFSDSAAQTSRTCWCGPRTSHSNTYWSSTKCRLSGPPQTHWVRTSVVLLHVKVWQSLEKKALWQGLGTEELERQPGIKMPRSAWKSKLFKSSDKQDFEDSHFTTTTVMSPRMSMTFSVLIFCCICRPGILDGRGQWGCTDGCCKSVLTGEISEVTLLPCGYEDSLVSIKDCQVFGWSSWSSEGVTSAEVRMRGNHGRINVKLGERKSGFTWYIPG